MSLSQADLDIAMEASLSETGLGSAAVRHDGVVPTIDLRDTDTAARQLWKAATTVGFFCVIGHGIPQSLIDDAFASSAGFFAQSTADKHAQAAGDVKHNAGFEHFAQVRPSTGVADQKESFQVTARQGVMDGRWPAQEGFGDTALDLMTRAHKL